METDTVEVAQFKKRVLEGATPEQLCEEFVLSDTVWLFEKMYAGAEKDIFIDNIFQYLSKNLSLSEDKIMIIGSAKCGFSLSPKKNLRPFITSPVLEGKASDIDLALISPKLFRSFWGKYLQTRYFGKKYIGQYKSDEVFRKFITIDPGEINEFQDKTTVKWLDSFNEIRRDFYSNFEIQGTINYRIYENLDALKYYHTYGIKKAMGKVRSL